VNHHSVAASIVLIFCYILKTSELLSQNSQHYKIMAAQKKQIVLDRQT